jgi:hypothetical protein
MERKKTIADYSLHDLPDVVNAVLEGELKLCALIPEQSNHYFLPISVTFIEDIPGRFGDKKGNVENKYLAKPGKYEICDSGYVIKQLERHYQFDTNPDSLSNAYDVTTRYMKNVFNPKTPDVKEIYYQSWAAKVKYACPTIVLDPIWRMLKTVEGPNDGLVSVESAKWGNFRGVESAAWWSPGCDHLNIIGHLFGLTPGFNAPSFYVNIVADLKTRGL